MDSLRSVKGTLAWDFRVSLPGDFVKPLGNDTQRLKNFWVSFVNRIFYNLRVMIPGNCLKKRMWKNSSWKEHVLDRLCFLKILGLKFLTNDSCYGVMIRSMIPAMEYVLILSMISSMESCSVQWFYIAMKSWSVHWFQLWSHGLFNYSCYGVMICSMILAMESWSVQWFQLWSMY